MDPAFIFFPRLPGELREEIWRLALTQNWSVTKFERAGRRVKLVGIGAYTNPSPAIGLVCHEAREIMKRTHIKIEAHWSTKWREGLVFLGWVNPSRHLFYFRDMDHNLGLLKYVAEHGILAHIQHLILNPGQYWGLLFDTVRYMMRYCLELRSLTLVAPWTDPNIPTVTIEPGWAPYEDFEMLFRKTPAEVDWTPLLNAIEDGNPYNMFQHGRRVDKMRLLTQKFPSGLLRLYLRAREELLWPYPIP